MKNNEWDSRELLAMLAHGQSLILEGTHSSIGYVYSLSVRDGADPGSSIIAVTDQNLLAKLRSIQGQVATEGLPIYYHEYLRPKKINRR